MKLKFSIIVPVYNVASYIEKCLLSLKKQEGDDFEVLVVNDGSTDHSLSLIESCVRDDGRFFVFTKENGDISDARNYGIERARGEYLLFVDGDDFVSLDYLSTLRRNLKKDSPDILRFQVFRHQYESGESSKCLGHSFVENGEEAFRILVRETYFDVVWAYAFRRDFFEHYHFRFEKGRRHEDFGLIPYVILKAKTVVSISDFLYYYVCRRESITTTRQEDNICKRMEDALYLYDQLSKKVREDAEISEEIKPFVSSYLANAMFGMGKNFQNKLFSRYILELKRRNVSSFLLKDTFFRKVKYFISRFFPKFYIRHLAK